MGQSHFCLHFKLQSILWGSVKIKANRADVRVFCGPYLHHNAQSVFRVLAGDKSIVFTFLLAIQETSDIRFVINKYLWIRYNISIWHTCSCGRILCCINIKEWSVIKMSVLVWFKTSKKEVICQSRIITR